MAKGSDRLIRRASRTIRRRGIALFGVSLWPFALCVIALLLLTKVSPPSPSGDPIQLWKSLSWLMRCSWIIAYIFSIFLAPMLAVAGVSVIVSAYQEGMELSLGDTLVRVISELGRLIALSFAVGFLATIGFRAFVLPGLAVLAIYTFVVPGIMLEGKGMRHAWRRSESLVGQSRGSVFALYGALTVTVIVIIFAFLALRPSDRHAAEIYFELCMLVAPSLVAVVFGTLNTLLFLDIRQRERALAQAVGAAE